MKKVKMIISTLGTANEHGSITRMYKVDEVLSTRESWQKTLAQSFIDAGMAIEFGGNEEPKETKKKPAKKRRARTKSGAFKADDPNTPENEAWEEAPVVHTFTADDIVVKKPSLGSS